jgi:hypothetical protein
MEGERAFISATQDLQPELLEDDPIAFQYSLSGGVK